MTDMTDRTDGDAGRPARPAHAAGTVLAQFLAPLRRSPGTGGWTYVVMPGSADLLGTRGLVKVRGTIDDEPFRSSFMALGGGTHKLPVKADVRRRIGKSAGDVVRVRLDERLS